MRSRKKVLHILGTLERGGAEMSLLRMLPLLSNDIESIFVTMGRKGSLAEKFEQAGIQVFSVEQRHFFDITSYGRLLRLLRRITPDLIVTHLLYTDILGRLFIQTFTPFKVISSLATTYNFPRYWPARLFEKWSHRLCAGYMANSHSVKRAYVERFGVPEEKIAVIQTGMDTEAFTALTPDEHLRQNLGIAPEDIVIICVANLHPNKGHRYLLEAFEVVHAHYPHTKLLIVGDGIEKVALLRQVTTYTSKEAILFLGKRSDVPALLALSHIFALPTFFEGMCNAIMEAMARGIPIVTTDIAENRELVTHEQTGLLCPLQESVLLAEAIERLIRDEALRHNLGQRAAQEMQEKYALKSTAERWKRYYLTTAE